MNDLIFQIPNFPPYPLPIYLLTQTKFCSQKSKAYQVLLSKASNFAKDIDLGGKVFFHGKIDFLFSLNSFVQDSRLLIFFKKNHPKLLGGIKMHVGAVYALDSMNSKL